MNHHHWMLAALLVASGTAQAADWTVQPGQSVLRFAGEMQGEGFEGGFGQFSADIRFDPADLASARFDVVVDLASVDSANSERDDALRGPDFFDVATTPQAHYQASHFRTVAPPGNYVAEGELTLNGHTQPVPLHFTWAPAGDGAVLEGRADLDRLAFGIGEGDWADPDMIGHEVKVTTRLVLAPAGG